MIVLKILIVAVCVSVLVACYLMSTTEIFIQALFLAVCLSAVLACYLMATA